ncbi:UNVERIFIED_CONTAM: hypothetical protein GTU68_027784, partial [Idotea baltica]|nr:hypothetical protein [Idotea baltica]
SLEGDSIFHKIIRKEIPAEIVYEDQDILAFKDVNPVAPTHILIIPKAKSIESLRSVDPSDCELLGQMLLVAKDIAKESGCDENGYRIVINAGEGAGQTVFQLHMHLLSGRELQWPPG